MKPNISGVLLGNGWTPSHTDETKAVPAAAMSTKPEGSANALALNVNYIILPNRLPPARLVRWKGDEWTGPLA